MFNFKFSNLNKTKKIYFGKDFRLFVSKERQFDKFNKEPKLDIFVQISFNLNHKCEVSYEEQQDLKIL